MSAVAENVQSAQYVDFWNQVLVPKFVKYKHILVDGLTHHSEAIFPSLPVKEGDKVLDIGCGFGDTAIKLAQRVGPKGKVMGLDCCDTFLEYGRKDAAKLGGIDGSVRNNLGFNPQWKERDRVLRRPVETTATNGHTRVTRLPRRQLQVGRLARSAQLPWRFSH